MAEKLISLKQLRSALLEIKNKIADVAGAAADAISEINSAKQNKLTGQPGQVVGFNKDGNASPQDYGTKVVALTKAEYDALEEKEPNVLYKIIDEPPFKLADIYVKEYDTDDGWHVRKYSDGYVEMDLVKPIQLPEWRSSGVVAWANLNDRYVFPVPLVKKYAQYSIVTSVVTSGLILSTFGKDDDPLIKSPDISFTHFVGAPLYTQELILYLKFTGCWKDQSYVDV